MNFRASLILVIALVVFAGVYMLLPQKTNREKISPTILLSKDFELGGDVGYAELALDIPHAKTTIPMPGVDIFPMPHPGSRTDTRTAMTRNGDIYVGGSGYLWKSTNRGQTWEMRKLPRKTAGGFGIINDDVFLLVFDVSGNSSSSVMRSTDYGQTWSEPVALDISPYGFSGSGWPHVYQHPDGTAMITMTLRKQSASHKFNDYIFRSTDGGKTWGDRTLLTPYSSETSQLALCNSNKMLAYIRIQRRPLPEDPPDFGKMTGVAQEQPWTESHLWPLKNGVVGESDDGGRTWKNLRLFETYGSVPGEILQAPDGRVAAVWLQRYPYGKAEILARISDDGGRTWGKKTYSVMKGMGYPSSVVCPDGTIVTVCEDTKMDRSGQPLDKRSIAAVRWRMPGRRKHE